MATPIDVVAVSCAIDRRPPTFPLRRFLNVVITIAIAIVIVILLDHKPSHLGPVPFHRAVKLSHLGFKSLQLGRKVTAKAKAES